MIHQATRVVERAVLAENLKCEVSEAGEHSVVNVTFSMKAGNSVTIHFISTDEKNDVALRVFGYIPNVDESKTAAILDACNKVNSQFRYAKFTLENGKVNVQMDIAQKIDADLGPVAVELLIRMVNIMDDAYPTFMKALWG